MHHLHCIDHTNAAYTLHIYTYVYVYVYVYVHVLTTGCTHSSTPLGHT
jgi:hypothetical protein